MTILPVLPGLFPPLRSPNPIARHCLETAAMAIRRREDVFNDANHLCSGKPFRQHDAWPSDQFGLLINSSLGRHTLLP